MDTKERKAYLKESIEIKERGLSLEEQKIKYHPQRVEAEATRVRLAQEKIKFHQAECLAAPEVIRRLKKSIVQDKAELEGLEASVKGPKRDDVKLRALGMFGRPFISGGVNKVLVGLVDGGLTTRQAIEDLDNLEKKFLRMSGKG